MAAYLILEHIITDAAKFEEYWTEVGPMIAKYGGALPDEGRQPQNAGGRALEARPCRHH
jgi:uncharacterized protein (DUF1330 family)